VADSTGAIRVLIAAGGTGGHLYPGIAIAEEWMRLHPDSKVVFVGTSRGPETKAVPRAGFTLVDAKAAKILRRYGLTVEDVWAGPQSLLHKMEGASVAKGLSKTFERDQKQIQKILTQLGKQIAKLDPTLTGTVERAKQRIEFHVEKLRQKVGKAQDQKAGLISTHMQYLESLLYPHKALQSRELCLLPFLARWGTGGLSELQKLASGKKIGHHFILQLP
jgi:uncharacterized protein YllA (UPF0747 family)